jgi:capsular exopolysaccharide synthesis family protein
VLNRAISSLDLDTTSDELAKSVTAEAAAGTVILDISVTDTDPAQAATIANTLAKQVVTVAGDLVPDSSNGKPAVRATVLAEATVPQQPSSPVLLNNLLVGALLGLLLGGAVALAREALDTRIRTRQDLRALTKGPVLGIIPFEPQASANRVARTGAWAEAVLRLRLNLESVANRSQARPIVITSAIEQEGKSTTALNLASSAADTGLRVLLIDADLRQPSLAKYLGLSSERGLTSVLTEGTDISTAVQQWGTSKVDVLSGGPAVSGPSELLASKAMAGVLSRLSHMYDLVLIDSPPLLQVPDAIILGRLAQGMVVVVGDRLRRPQLRAALDALSTVDVNLLGLVLNKVAHRNTNAHLNRSRIIEWELPEADLPAKSRRPGVVAEAS